MSLNDSMWDAVGDATMVYGVQTGLLDYYNPPDAMTDDASGFVTVEYGAPHGQQVVTVQQRDDWWKWALGAGIVTVGAYAIYQHVTGGKP